MEKMKVVQDALDQVNRLCEMQRGKIHELEPTAVEVQSVIDSLEMQAVDVRIQLGYAEGSMQGVLVMVHGDGGYSPVSDVRLVNPMHRELRRIGFKLHVKSGDLDYDGVDDYPEMGRRTYLYERGKEVVRLSIFLQSSLATIATPGTACRYVQVGVEAKPVYKLMCEDHDVSTIEGESL